MPVSLLGRMVDSTDVGIVVVTLDSLDLLHSTPRSNAVMYHAQRP